MSPAIWRFNVNEDEETKSYGYRYVQFRLWLVTFLRETTLQGVPMVMKRPGVLKKLFWITAIALCALGLEWELSAFFTKFLSWSASTSVSIQTARVLPFPAITICNNNPVTTDWFTEQQAASKKSAAGMGPGPPNVAGGLTATGNTGGSTGGGLSGPVASGTSNTGVSTGGVAASTGVMSASTIGSVSSAGTTGGSTGGVTASTASMGASTVGSVSIAGTSGGSAGSGGPSGAPPPLKIRRKRQLPSGPGMTTPSSSGGTVVGSPPPAAPPNLAASVQQKLALQAKACLVTYENRSQVGHQLCDMVMAMEYQGESLDPGTNFSTWHWNPFYGNCFTFNAGYTLVNSATKVNSTWEIKRGVNGDGIRMSTQSGDSFGLYLLLNADTDHYLSWTRQVGWRIVIHNQTEMPFPEESGVFVAPGTSTRIGLSMSYMKRLGIVDNILYNAPYSDCVDESRLIVDDPRNAYSKMLEVSYTKSACLKTCYQLNVMKACGCFDFNYPNRGSAFVGYESVPPCTYDNQTLWKCQFGVATAYQNTSLQCDCPETCTTYSFGSTISHLKWPSPASSPLQAVCDELYDILMNRTAKNDSTCQGMSYLPAQAVNQSNGEPEVAKRMKQCLRNQMAPMDGIGSLDDIATQLVGSQFAEVYIFYRDFNYQTIEESEFLEFADLLAYMGGILGLFFGFTFLTLFEYIELVIDLIIIGIGFVVNLCQITPGLSSVSPGGENKGKLPPEHQYDGNGPITRRRSMHLKSQLRPGSCQSDTTLMPPSQNLYNNAQTGYGFPLIHFAGNNNNEMPPDYNVMTSKKYY